MTEEEFIENSVKLLNDVNDTSYETLEEFDASQFYFTLCYSSAVWARKVAELKQDIDTLKGILDIMLS